MSIGLKIKKPALSGDGFILSAMAIFGSYSLFLRLMPNVSTLAFVFTFQAVGAIAFFVAVIRHGLPKLNFRTAMFLVALALVAIGNDISYFASFRNTTIANAAMAHQSVSIFLLIFAPLFLKEKTERNEWIALLPAFAGIAIIYSNGASLGSSRDILGISLGLLSGLFYSLLIILYRFIPARRGLNIRVINLYRYVISIVVLLPFVSLFNLGSIQKKDLLPLLGFGLLFAFIASGIHTFGISRTRPLHASILGKTEPVFATVYAALFLNEKPSLTTLIGGSLIIGAGVWLAFRKRGQVSSSKTILAA